MEPQDLQTPTSKLGNNAGKSGKTTTKSNDEGATTRAIEQATATMPSTVWLVGAGGAMLLSVVMKLTGRSETANFVGQWVPTLLLFGIYNKIVKVAGSDRHDAGRDGRPA